MIKLYKHQVDALTFVDGKSHVAFYHDMGLGKTYTGAEKMHQLGGRVNLVICQKSKIDDWYNHFYKNYDCYIADLTNGTAFEIYAKCANELDRQLNKTQLVGIINYDLIFRRKELLKLRYDTIMLDESSMIQNDTAKRTKAIMKLDTDNVILLSGTPTGGKYENLWSQLKLLGWDISKKDYWDMFVETRLMDMGGFKLPIVTGYKNIGKLKRQMRRLGCHFLKTDEVFDLPSQTFSEVVVEPPKEYKVFRQSRLVDVVSPKSGKTTLVGDTILTQMLYERQLCGMYCKAKLDAFTDILDSTDERLIVFYNFTAEYEALAEICKKHKREVSVVNGCAKDLTAYEQVGDSVTLIQYQSGAMGLNLQLANKIVYFTPPLSSELYEQSKKRIHRIGQNKPCFYYNLICRGSVEKKIYETLAMRQNYTEKLFAKG